MVKIIKDEELRLCDFVGISPDRIANLNKTAKYAVSVHIWVKNDNLWLIQKRSRNKKTNPNLWSIVGGGVHKGESYLSACHRESLEEIGVIIGNLVHISSFVKYKTIFDVWYSDMPINLHELKINDEVEEIKLATKEEILDLSNNGQFADFVLLGLADCEKYLNQ